MASTSLARLQEKLSRAKSSAALARRNAGGKRKPIMKVGAVAAGGALAALIDNKLFPGGIAGRDASLIVGGVIVVGGIFGMKPGPLSEYALLLGAGVLNPSVNDKVADLVADEAGPLAAVGN